MVLRNSGRVGSRRFKGEKEFIHLSGLLFLLEKALCYNILVILPF